MVLIGLTSPVRRRAYVDRSSVARSPQTCRSGADEVRAGINLRPPKLSASPFRTTLLARADEVIE